MVHKEKNSVTVISQYYYPDIATTGQLLTELGGGLVNKGWAVDVITALPTYDSQIKAVRYEKYRGVSIQRVWSTKFNKNTKYGKIFNSISFFVSALMYVISHRINGVLLIVSNPPFLPLIGYVSSVLKRTKFIYLVHDVYPDIAVRLGYLRKGALTEKIWGYINKVILRSASKIIVLSDSMRRVVNDKIMSEYHVVLKGKIKVIHNWADGESIRPINRQENNFVLNHGLLDSFVVLYSGNMGLFHELEMVIEVANKIYDKNIKFIFIGDGGKKKLLEKLVSKYSLENVVFMPYQPKNLLPLSLTSASVALVTLEENIEGLAMPSKLYTLMAAGNPIIAICDEGSDVAKIINNANCGFAIKHHDIARMVECIIALKNDPILIKEMSRNARSYFEQHFSLDSAINNYGDVMLSVIDSDQKS